MTPGGGGAAPEDTAARAVRLLTAARLTVATCESLTAGLVAATLASVPGASAVLRGGLITYATDAKHTLAGVDADLLARRGAVDPDVAAQMARGARLACGASIGLSCTGVAGPDPQDGMPVGTVFLALDRGDLDREDSAPIVQRLALAGDRETIRRDTVEAGLRLLLAALPAD